MAGRLDPKRPWRVLGPTTPEPMRRAWAAWYEYRAPTVGDAGIEAEDLGQLDLGIEPGPAGG